MAAHGDRWGVWAEPSYPNVAEPRWWGRVAIPASDVTDVPMTGSRAWADAHAATLGDHFDLRWSWRFVPKPYPSSESCCAVGGHYRPVCELPAGHDGPVHRDGDITWPLVKTSLEREIDASVSGEAVDQLQFCAEYLKAHLPGGPNPTGIITIIENVTRYLKKVKHRPDGLHAPFSIGD
jgi:hypothetical protein